MSINGSGLYVSYFEGDSYVYNYPVEMFRFQELTGPDGFRFTGATADIPPDGRQTIIDYENKNVPNGEYCNSAWVVTAYDPGPVWTKEAEACEWVVS
jgi:hypothetical protein